MSKASLKRSITTVPIIGYLARVISNVVKLPESQSQMLKAQAETKSAINDIKKDYQIVLKKELTEVDSRLSSLQLTHDNLKQQISILESKQHAARITDTIKDEETLFADDHLLDKFYTAFEDRFRGAEDLITERQKEYLQYFKKSKIDFDKTPVLDIGSGRGEFLQLLSKNNIGAIGLDINHDMVERSIEKGLNAIQGDAISHLQEVKSQTYGAITGFHIVEHIPFPALLRIFNNAHRALVTAGFVIFETPNPENVVVGSSTFYMDPSHLHPLPPPLLAFALETCGFRSVEILRLHPDDSSKYSNELDKEVASRLFGPRDYAVIGFK